MAAAVLDLICWSYSVGDVIVTEFMLRVRSTGDYFDYVVAVIFDLSSALRWRLPVLLCLLRFFVEAVFDRLIPQSAGVRGVKFSQASLAIS